MISQVIKTSLMSLGLGFLLQLLQLSLQTQYLNEFLYQNLITILIALLAINSTTMGIVLTKIKDLVEKHGNSDKFNTTRQQMVLSVQEQIGLIIISTLVLTLSDSKLLNTNGNYELLMKSIVIAVFIYGLSVLYDTARSVLIIIDYDG